MARPHRGPPPQHRASSTGLRWNRATVRRLNATKRQASSQRRAQDSGTPRRPTAVVWTAALLRQLGQRFDRDIANQLGVSKQVVARKRQALHIRPRLWRAHAWSSLDIRRLLGSAPDAHIAQRLGVCALTISVQRRAVGIPAYRTTHPRVAWTPARVALLGRISDTALAARLGVSLTAIAFQRRKRGIAAFHR